MAKSLSNHLLNKKTVSYVCLQCHEEEAIPLKVVRDMDMIDDGDPTVPPQFQCEVCEGVMVPIYYRGVHGHEYRVEDFIGK